MSGLRAGTNPEQRQAADPALSVWVSANAGSGKTKVLVDRIMRLLLAGATPDRILALTYTRSAAAEMATRLGTTLGAWAVAEADQLDRALAELLGRAPEQAERRRARQLFAHALESPGGLKIRTIHGFCQSLLARFPIEAGLAPHFRVIEGSEQADFLADARDTVLAGLAESDEPAAREALADIMAQIEETRFGALVGELALGQGRTRLIRPLGELLLALRRALALPDDASRASVIAEACRDDGFDLAGLRRAAAALQTGGRDDGACARRILAWLEAGPGRHGSFETEYRLAYFNLKGERRKRLPSKALLGRHADLAPLLEAEAARIEAVCARLAAADIAHLTGLICGLVGRMLGEYAARKRAVAALDYDDLIIATLALLERPGIAPWVLYKLDGGIDHILVDEAQDTSPEQWRIVAALADEFFAGEGARAGRRTLFAVGDEKQSIYGFQGAVPAEFGRYKERFRRQAAGGERPFLPVDLGVSFRSAPAILDVVDAVFETPAAQQAVTAGGHWVPHRAHRAQAHGLVEIWPTMTPADAAPEPDAWAAPLDRIAGDDPKARLAARIAGAVRRWLEAADVLPSTGRRVRPQDILILVRRRSAFVDEMVRHLKVAGVPVAGADRMKLVEQIAVKDLLAAIGAAILPDDDLTLACALRSPLIGLSEQALFELAHDRGPKRLWRALAERADEPPFAAAHARVRAWLAAADRLPPFEFLSRILEEAGGRAALAARLGPECGDPVDELLQHALAYERNHPPSLQGFHHWVGTHDAEVKRDLEQGGDAVRIMTVHAAKGLEAPIVILPDTCQAPDHKQEGSVFWLGPAGDIPAWVPAAAMHVGPTLAARERRRQAQAHEYLRLLYVAMTRAQDRLYVTGYETTKGRAETCWYDAVDAVLRRIGRSVEQPGLGEVRRYETGTPAPGQARVATGAPAPAALPDWALRRPAEEPRPPRPLAPSRPAGEEPAALAPGEQGGRRFRRGLLIHRLLQTLPSLDPAAREAAALAYLARAARELGEAERRAIADETLRIFAMPEAAPLFAPGSRAEVPIAGRIGDEVIAGQVDRLAVEPGRVLLIDYKTNRPPPARVEDVPAIYRRQMGLYAAVLGRVFPDRPVEALILWTDGPRLMRLPVEILELPAP